MRVNWDTSLTVLDTRVPVWDTIRVMVENIFNQKKIILKKLKKFPRIGHRVESVLTEFQIKGSKGTRVMAFRKR